jgi:histidinol-phosphatase (PHP family)
MLIDYHIHTAMSDGKGELAEYVKIARDRGFAEIGVSDHFHPEEPEWSMTYETLAEYVKNVQLLRKRTDFPVKLGVEADFVPNLERKIAEVIKMYPFDYVIGSVHFIDNWGFDDPEDISGYQKWDIAKLYETYFSLVQQCAKSGLFDIIGHIDYIKTLGYKPKADLSEVFLNTVEVLKDSEVCVEVNTGGLSAPCREMYPSKAFLKMCFDNEVPITLGSDAHKPQDLGDNFDQALRLIREVGYEKVARFTRRQLELIEI